MPIVDPSLGLGVVILGLLLIAGGIVVAAVVYREGRKMKGQIMPLLDMMDGMDWSTLVPGGMANLMPMLMAFAKDMLGRMFNYLDIAGLLGGAAVSIVGVIVFFMGFAIMS